MNPISDDLLDEIIARATRTARQTVEDRLAEDEEIVTRGPTGIIHMPGGQEYNRREFDFYPTPLALCKASLNILPENFSPYWMMDPGAGDGPWGEAAVDKWPGLMYLYGVELRAAPRPPAYDHWKSEQDFLQIGKTNWGNNGYDLIAGNPPYAVAEDFIWQSRAQLNPNGYIVFLLRLAFLEGQKRSRKLWKEFKPKSVHVCAARPSFMPVGHPKEGKTDATAYAVFVWQAGWTGTTELRWLDWK